MSDAELIEMVSDDGPAPASPVRQRLLPATDAELDAVDAETRRRQSLIETEALAEITIAAEMATEKGAMLPATEMELYEFETNDSRVALETLIAPGEEGIAARESAFAAVDTNKDGTITRMEALAAIAALWEDFDNLNACMMAYEAANRSGKGLEATDTQLFFQYQAFYHQVSETFKLADANGDGTINSSEFASLEIDSYYSPEETFAMIDVDGTQSIDLREFCTWYGLQEFEEEDELADIQRAFQESAIWFGKSDADLLEIVAQRDANLNLITLSPQDAKAKRATLEALAKPGKDGINLRAEAFKAVDSDDNGIITRNEALAAISKLWNNFDNLSACMMAYDAADRNGAGLTWRETRLFFQYQVCLARDVSLWRCGDMVHVRLILCPTGCVHN
jgi:Ca2+-binding EF-hand superfamily protein